MREHTKPLFKHHNVLALQNLYGHVQKKVALEIDFFKCILKIVIALCWLLYLSRPLEIRCNYMMLKSRSLYCLYHMSYRY